MAAGLDRLKKKKLPKFHNISGEANTSLNNPFFLLMMFVRFVTVQKEEDNPDNRNQGAKFAAAGKSTAKKDLGLMAMMYHDVYVARVAMGANDAQTVRAFIEAEAYDGPSIIIAYSHCIAHGIDMARGMTNQKIAVETGYFPLFRYNPELTKEGKNPFKLDSKAPKGALADFTSIETRFNVLTKINPERAKELLKLAEEDVKVRWAIYEQFANESSAGNIPAAN